MSTNCLLTKLKATVDNENLPYYNAFSVKVRNTQSASFCDLGVRNVIGGTKFKILQGDVQFTNNNGDNLGKEFTATANGSVLVKGAITTNFVVLILDKYTFHGFQGSSQRYMELNVEDLEYDSSLEMLAGDILISGSLSLLKNSGLQKYGVSSTAFSVPLADLGQISTIDYIDIRNGTGDVKALARLASLTNLYLSESVSSLYENSDLLEFVAARRTAVGASGSLVCRIPRIKLNGTNIPGDNMTLVWDATSVTCKFGGTPKNAYTYNITAEQKTALETDGYTVIEC